MGALKSGGETSEPAAYLPFEIGKTEVFAKAGRKLWVLVKGQPGADPSDQKIKKADLKILDESGTILAQISGFRSVRAPKEELIRRLAEQKKTSVSDYFYELSWKEKPLVLLNHELSKNVEVRTQKKWLIFKDKNKDQKGLGEKLTLQIQKQGDLVSSVEATTDLLDLNAYEKLLSDIGPVDEIIHLWCLDCKAFEIREVESQKKVYESTLLLAQALVKNQALTKKATGLCLVTKGALAVGTDQKDFNLAQSPMVGLGRVIALEHPELKCKRVDLDPEDKDDSSMVVAEDCSRVSRPPRPSSLPRRIQVYSSANEVGTTNRAQSL